MGKYSGSLDRGSGGGAIAAMLSWEFYTAVVTVGSDDKRASAHS